jgi:hypothetical protein
MRPVYEAVAALTDAFCLERLSEEYRDLARAMIAALRRKRPSPLTSGQPRSCASGVVHVLGQLHFPFDRTTKPYMTMADVAAGFGVGESMASAISDALRLRHMDPAWVLRDLVEQNPIIWLIEVNGLQIAVDRSRRPRRRWSTERPSPRSAKSLTPSRRASTPASSGPRSSASRSVMRSDIGEG